MIAYELETITKKGNMEIKKTFRVNLTIYDVEADGTLKSSFLDAVKELNEMERAYKKAIKNGAEIHIVYSRWDDCLDDNCPHWFISEQYTADELKETPLMEILTAVECGAFKH